MWEDHKTVVALQQERASLRRIVEKLDETAKAVSDAMELAGLIGAKEDGETLSEIEIELDRLEKEVQEIRMERFFSHPDAEKECFLSVQAGSGGTEAQDWADMLRRMYVQYCSASGFNAELMEETQGDVAGIKGATLKVRGSRTYGQLRTESGIHRLVRKSPFDSSHRRHTSFASVFVCPIVNQDFEIEILDKDLRIDTYRASGAGGQHVNTTDSAVRITHLPTGVVVQCQSDRSQHRNRAEALSMLKSHLYRLELENRNQEKMNLEKDKPDIGWGHQIRSYVLDQSRVKDIRTGYERGDPQRVLDGDIQDFINTTLLAGY